MTSWKTEKLGKLVTFSSGGTPSKQNDAYWNGSIPWISAKTMKSDRIGTSDLFITEEGLANGSKLAEVGSLLLLVRGSGLFNGIPICYVESPVAYNQDVKCINSCSEIENEFIYYWIKANSDFLQAKLDVTGIGAGKFDMKFLSDLDVMYPDKETRKKIIEFANNITDKLQVNEAINRNLEDQLKAIFIELFGAEIDDVKIGTGTPLGELIDVIDNRGKTPPLNTETSDFPIIDVGALRGNVRVVDFNNCTKFVDEDTYNNWFRSGHPKPWDILLSTVGSLAEMKIFLGEKGCIAQNVVALRSKSIAPLFLYQYLNYIRNDLVAYNIGSVQPSIKVTHIIKHPIFVPDDNRLADFDDTAKVISDQIYNLYCESEILKGIRDSLLPKLMSGELDVSDLYI